MFTIVGAYKYWTLVNDLRKYSKICYTNYRIKSCELSIAFNFKKSEIRLIIKLMTKQHASSNSHAFISILNNHHAQSMVSINLIWLIYFQCLFHLKVCISNSRRIPVLVENVYVISDGRCLKKSIDARIIDVK